MKMKVFKFHNDAGHGWLAVKRAFLNELDLGPEISGYSYQRGSTVYLEEDGDLSRFVLALVNKGWKRGVDWEMSVCRPRSGKFPDRSPIRSYESYKYHGWPA